MNMILVAGTVSHAPYALGGDGLLVLLLLGAAGAGMLLASALLLRKHAPEACPTRPPHYTGESR